MVHAGHANTNYVMRLVNGNLDSLTNEGLFLVNSIGCYCGAFNSSDCIAEEFMKRNAHGAFAAARAQRSYPESGAQLTFARKRLIAATQRSGS